MPNVLQQDTSDSHQRIEARRWQVALILIAAGFAIVPLTVSAELALGWLSPHGDGMLGVLLSVVVMPILCAASLRILEPTVARSDPMESRRRVARAVAILGIAMPLGLLTLMAFLAMTSTPRQ